MTASPGTIAGIVVYHPDEAELARLVARVAPEVEAVVVFANSPLGEATEARLRAGCAAPVSVIRPGRNVGLGDAYDAFVARAEAVRARFVLILDQDSLPDQGMVPRLAAVHDALRQADERPALVGPRPVGPDGLPLRIPVRKGAARSFDQGGNTFPLHAEVPPGGGPRRTHDGGASLEADLRSAPQDEEGGRLGSAFPVASATRVEFAISSGSLVDVAAARAIGPFRSDFFIDAIDLEWCMRANHLGFSVWVADRVFMDHRLGRGVIAIPGLRLADQPPRRLYTFVRNQLAMLRLPHVPRLHKLKTVASLPARLAIYLVRNRFSRDCRAALARTNEVIYS